QLFPGVFQSLVGKGERLFIDAGLLIGADQVPINVFDLRDRGDHLVFEGDVGDFLVVLRDTQVAQVGAKTKSRQKLLLESEAVVRIQSGRQEYFGTVGRLAIVIEGKRNRGAGGKSLRIKGIHGCRIQLQRGNIVEYVARLWQRQVLDASAHSEGGIIRGNGSSHAQSRLHQA